MENYNRHIIRLAIIYSFTAIQYILVSIASFYDHKGGPLATCSYVFSVVLSFLIWAGYFIFL